jgi:hypothetical protein
MKKNNILFRILLIDDNRTAKTEYTKVVEESKELFIWQLRELLEIFDFVFALCPVLYPPH